MFILQITATLNLVIWIPLVGVIISSSIAIATVIQVRRENKDKMATKSFVIEKVSAVEETIKEHKADNLREHDDIKREFIGHVKSLSENIKLVAGFIKEKTG